MSVEFIIGRAGVGKTFTCLKKAQTILKNSPMKTEIFFLLPAYQTYRVESELAKITGGAVNTRMYSFNQLAKQILSEVGGAILQRISGVGRRLILRKILLRHDKAGDLKYFQRAAKQRGFAENLDDELQELRAYALNPEELLTLTEKITDEDLNAKLHDFSILLTDFKNEIAGKLNDDEDLLEQAAEFMKDSQSIKRMEIFIDGYIFFNPQQRTFLHELFKYAKNVTVALSMDTNLNSLENTDELGIFNREFETFKNLRDTAEEVGADFKITRLEIPHRFKNDSLKYIEENFFKYSPKSFKNSDGLKIVEAVNRRVEIEAAAREILKLRKEKNYRFRDIGIISRSDEYGNLIKPIFEIHGIPFFVDKKRPANNHPLAEFLRSSLEILHGWRAESIFRCLRTGFFEIPQTDIDLLENYVIECGIRGENVWKQSEAWHWHKYNLDEPADEPNKSEAERMKKVDKIRRAAISETVNFSERIKKVTKKSHIKVIDLAKILFELVENLKIPEKLVEWSDAEESRGNLSLAKEHLKIWDDVVTLFEQIVNSLGDDEITLKEFESILGEGLDALEMSLIPPGLDEVSISNFDQNALQNSKAIFILGMSDEDFPKKTTEKGLFSDADRLRLNDIHAEISKGGLEKMFAEKFLLYRGLTLATEFLYISYPLANSEGGAMHPSTFVAKFKKIFPAVEFETVPLDVLNSLGTEIEYTTSENKISADIAKKLYAPKKKLNLSVTQIENFNMCQFQYFLNYGLRLKERPEYTIQPVDVGNLLHAVMKNFGERMKKNNRSWASVKSDKLKEIVDEILSELAPNLNNKILNSTNAYKHQGERIKKTAIHSLARLIELDKVSKFHPQFFEENLNDLQNNSLEYMIEDIEMELRGKIDRIDLSEDKKYFLIIDYKTGEAHINLPEIFVGVNIQLLTYLMATNKISEVENFEPAGMFYYFLKYPTKSGDDVETAEKNIAEDLKLVGKFLDGKEIIPEDNAKNFIATITKSSLNSAQFKILINFVEELLKNSGEKILRGDIQSKPFQSKNKDACQYCDYSAICKFNPRMDEINSVPSLDDNEILKKMMEK